MGLKRMPLLNDFKSAGENTRRFIDLKIEEIIFGLQVTNSHDHIFTSDCSERVSRPSALDLAATQKYSNI